MMPDLSELKTFIDKLLQATDLQSVFLAAFLEKYLFIIPSYALFPAIGMGARDASDLALRGLVAVAGSVAGAMGWYLVGALAGPVRIRQMLERHGRWISLTPQTYERIAATYQHRPFDITLIGQLIPTVRIVQALPAGVLRLPLIPFLAATTLGALCWNAPLVAAGHLLRQCNWSASEAGIAVILCVLTIEVMIFVAARRRLAIQKRSNGD